MRKLILAAFAMLALGLTVTVPVSAATEPTKWPSLRSQIERSGIQPESALAQLIKENQDFANWLRPEESKDNRGLPPWIRVWWRKQHPEMEYPPISVDPTGGYPLVLKEIYEWMYHHQDLQRGTPEPDLAPGQVIPAIAATITGEQRISGAQTTPRSESDIRINFFDPTKIISASNSIVGGGFQSQFWSTDGGSTWGQTTLPTTGGDTSHSDPTVDWTSDSMGWSSTLGVQGGTLRLRTYNSANFGQTWTFEATPSAAQTSVDKQMHWVDHGASACANRQYITYHNGTPAFVTVRNPGTNTWSAPFQITGAESTGTAIGGDVKTNAMGDAFVFWPTTTNRIIGVRKSTDCGATWAPFVQIGTTFDGFDIGVPSFNNRRALIYISGGAFRNGSKNLVHASWTDLTGVAGCTAAANEPGANAASTCKTRIWYSRSTDGGATWSAKVMINNQASLNDQYNQWLAVDEMTGQVAMIYYDTVDDATRLRSNVYYQTSFDDGVTWQPPVKVTTAQTNETGGGQDGGNQYGDYNGLSGFAGNFWPSWTDRRGGAREEIWTAKINDPACTAPGAPITGTATATAANQVTVTWTNGAPASTSFNVYRAIGTCAAPGTFTQVATGLAGSPFVDNAVSGSVTYAYRITGRDVTANCESTQSTCVEVTATGTCNLPPTFAGLTTVSNPGTSGCALNLAWSAATPQCAGPISYNVYRSTTAGFTPMVANQIATGVSPTSYSDTSPLMNGVTYYYKVRAVDGGNSQEETNVVEKSNAPTGPIAVGSFSETFEGAMSGGGFDNAGWTHSAITGANDWVLSTAQSQTPTHSQSSVSLASVSSRQLVSPSFVIQAGTTMSFFHTFAFEGTLAQCFDAGVLQTSNNGGMTWTTMPDANFTAGGHNGTVNGGFSNPLAASRAWCAGTIGAMTQVTLNLATFNGQTLKFRWIEGDDSSAIGTGWFVDSVAFSQVGTAGVCTPSPVQLLDFEIQ